MHHSIVEQELITFCQNLHSLEHCLFYGAGCSTSPINTNSTSSTLLTRQFGYAPILFASVALFGIVDIHPFVDGNGRLARIIANWALQRGGLPFTINICATPTQCAEYVTAIELTRRNLNLKTVGGTGRNGGGGDGDGAGACISSPSELFPFLQQCAGLFQPMVHLIMDRVYRSVIQCENVIQESFARQSEEEEAAIARKYRENAAKGTCLICFDDHPNIATLCCGRAVHMNCLVEWLSSKNTCPYCRGSMPSLTRRAVNPPQPPSLDNTYALSHDSASLPSLSDGRNSHVSEQHQQQHHQQEIGDGDSTLDFETYEHDEHDETVSISNFYEDYNTTYQPDITETIDDTTTFIEQNDNGDYTTFIVVQEEFTTTIFDRSRAGSR